MFFRFVDFILFEYICVLDHECLCAVSPACFITMLEILYQPSQFSFTVSNSPDTGICTWTLHSIRNNTGSSYIIKTGNFAGFAACGQRPALRQRCHWLAGLIEAFWARNHLALHIRSLHLWSHWCRPIGSCLARQACSLGPVVARPLGCTLIVCNGYGQQQVHWEFVVQREQATSLWIHCITILIV